MKQANITILLYSFQELSETAKQAAIDDHRQFLLSNMRQDDFISGDPQYDTPEELQKAYDSEYEYYLENDEPIIESIEANEYMFFNTGKLANVTNYVSGYGELNGRSFVKIDGNSYELSEVN